MALVCAAACGGAASTRPGEAPTANVGRSTTLEGEAAPYHSKKFALSLPLPELQSWKVDARRETWWIALHAPTRSVVRIARIRTDDLMNRERCEELARTHGLARPRAARAIEDRVSLTHDGFDTRVWVGIRPGKSEVEPISGDVMAFGAQMRQCFFFHFSTKVGSAREESVLSTRLAVADSVMLRGLEFDAPFMVERDAPPEKTRSRSRGPR